MATPDTIAGLIGWYDAADIDPAHISGTDVTGWDNKATGGSALPDLDSLGATDPQLVSGVARGAQTVVRFDGTGQHLKTLVATALTDPVTVFMVATLDAAADMRVLVDAHTSSTDVHQMTGRGDTLLLALYNGAESVSAAPPANTDPPDIHAFIMGTTTIVGRNNGAVVQSKSAGAYKTWDALTLGNYRSGSATLAMVGDIYELLIYDAELGTTDVETVEAYLSDKWVIPLVDGDTGGPFFTEDTVATWDGFAAGHQGDGLYVTTDLVYETEVLFTERAELAIEGAMQLDGFVSLLVEVPVDVPAGVTQRVFVHEEYVLDEPTGWVDGKPVY